MSIIETIKTYSGFNLFKTFVINYKIGGYAYTSLYNITKVLSIRISRGKFFMRSASISWSIFFSLFPFTLFLFGVLPHFPYYAEIKNIFFINFLPHLLPDSLKTEVISYIENTIRLQETKHIKWYLIVITFLLSSNGIQGIISSFNTTYQNLYSPRKGNRSRIISLVLTLFFSVVIVFQILVSYCFSIVWKIYKMSDFFSDMGNIPILINYIAVFLFYFISMCTIYTFCPNHKKSPLTIIPGAFLTSILFILTAVIFNLYLKYFTSVNIIYGSLVLVIMTMSFVYTNVILLIIGFELNMSLFYTKNYHRLETIELKKNIKLNP